MKYFKTITIILFYLPVVCFAVPKAPLNPGQCVHWPAYDFQPIPNAKTKQIAPDYGIYWFKMQGSQEIVAKAFTSPALAPQLADGTLNQIAPHETMAIAKKRRLEVLEKQGFFDPSKPTLLVIHGVQPGTVIKHNRFDFCYQYPTSGEGDLSSMIDTLPFWHDFNVAVFYWNQFADENVTRQGPFASLDSLVNPETRIYTSTSKAGMHWVYINSNGEIADCSADQKQCMALPVNSNDQMDSVSELAFKAYQDALPEGYQKPVRLVGFSLGNQVAIMLANKIADHPNLPQLSQLVLLDPYYTPNYYKIDVGSQKVAIAPYDEQLVKKLIAKDARLGLVFYRSSKASQGMLGNDNVALQNIAAFLKVSPEYLKNVPDNQQILQSHVAGVFSYLYSKKFPEILSKQSYQEWLKSYPSASSSLADIRALMGKRRNCVLPDADEPCQSE